MRNDLVVTEPIELCLAHSENRLLIENHADKVVIRAATDHLSPREKTCLIRYLAAEGFIPDRYKWFADSETAFFPGLSWLFDFSRAKRLEPRQKALRQIVFVLLCAILAWLELITFAFLQAPSH